MESTQKLLLDNLIDTINTLSKQLDSLNRLALDKITSGDGVLVNEGPEYFALNDEDWQIILGRSAQMKKAHQIVCDQSVRLEKLIKG